MPTDPRPNFAELEQRNREIGLLRDMGSLLHGCLTVEEIYSIITEFARHLFPAESGTIYVLNAVQKVLEPVAFWGQSTAGEGVFLRDDCWALRLGRTHWVEDPNSRLLCLHVRQVVFGPYICVPMMAQGEVLGVLHLRARPQEPLTESKQRLASAAAEQIALPLANLKLRLALHEQALRDPLTNLFNRRYLEESLERELRRATRNQLPLGVVMLDLDHFKRFNDRFGHQAGDVVLRALGDLLRKRTRGGDIACRYGGEEFTLVLPEAPLKVTIERAEHLRQRVKELTVHHADQLVGGLSLSLGVASFPEHASTPGDLLRTADLALYQAKSGGRDRVVVGGAVT